MIVTIWRHGEAGAAARDAMRSLTTNGRQDIVIGAEQFLLSCSKRDIAPPELIVHSPYQRTLETATRLQTAFGLRSMQAAEALEPEALVEDVDELLVRIESVEHVLLVSHQPLVSALADRYLGDIGVVPFLSPGGLFTLDLPIPAPGCGALMFWALPPSYQANI